jgi:NADH-quinone oxidoreductase subunit L
MLDFIYSNISIQNVAWTMVAAPLLGALLCVILMAAAAHSKRRTFFGSLACVSVLGPLVSFVAAVVLYATLTGFEDLAPALVTGPLYKWVALDFLVVDVALRIDQLSLSIALAISLVAIFSAIHTAGLAVRDKSYGPQTALLGCFTGFALLGVLSDNFIVMIVAWEIAAFCVFSVFSISSGKQQEPTSLILEILSFCLLLAASFFIYGAMQASGISATSGIYNFETMERAAPFFMPYAGAMSFLVIAAVAVKSALFPFFSGIVKSYENAGRALPIILAGISASLGIYLIVRLGFIIVMSPDALMLLRMAGISTIVFSALFCIVETDLMAAASWLVGAQFGYMIFSCGIGAFVSCVYHMLVSYSFSVLMVMASAGVVEACGKRSTIFMMGGVKHKMPVTFWCFMIGAISCAAVFPAAGFFSKDAILWQAFERGYIGLWIAGFVGTGLLSFAVFRIAGSVFFGSSEIPEGVFKRMVESPVSMVLPMMLLATATILLGFIGIPEEVGGSDTVAFWLGEAVTDEISRAPSGSSPGTRIALMIVTFLFSIHFSVLGWLIYAQKRGWPVKAATRMELLYRMLLAHFYLDSFFAWIFIKIPNWICKRIVGEIIYGFVAGRFLMETPVRIAGFASRAMCFIQNGEVQRYIMYAIIGAVVAMLIVVL